MEILMILIVGTIVYLIGVFGWAQIIGCLQSVRERGIVMTLITLFIWVGILGTSFLIAESFFSKYMTVYFIVMVISFIQVILAGKIE
jgi:hypothetical protein